MFGYAGKLPDKLWKLFTLGEFIKEIICTLTRM